jgi:amino acid transporter
VLPQIIDSFWLLLDVASQISLIYYVILFASCIKLRYMSASSRETFKIPGGFYWLWPIMGLGILTSILAFISGFIAPADLLINDAKTFHIVMLTGLSISFILPLLLFKFRRELPRKHCG